MSEQGRARSMPHAGVLMRDDWPVLVALPAVASLFVFAVPSLGWWAFVAALAVYVAGFIGFERSRAAATAQRELTSALGRIAELAALAPPGHTLRAPRLAADIAGRLDLKTSVAAAIERASAMRAIGRVAVEGRDDLPSAAADHLAARHSAAIARRAGTLAPLTTLLGPEAPLRDAPARARAVVDLAAAYDEAVAWRGLDRTAALARLAETGRADVVHALRITVALAPD